jgi:hypothetical protein
VVPLQRKGLARDLRTQTLRRGLAVDDPGAMIRGGVMRHESCSWFAKATSLAIGANLSIDDVRRLTMPARRGRQGCGRRGHFSKRPVDIKNHK